MGQALVPRMQSPTPRELSDLPGLFAGGQGPRMWGVSGPLKDWVEDQTRPDQTRPDQTRPDL
eukprot:6883797-Alexandrium_andersonii.AAC.1